MPIFSTLCTGGAGADYGAKLAGMDHGFGVEYNPALPTKQSLACKVLGNMVIPLVMKAIIESNIA